jgi:hypothetical protein
LHSVGGLIGAAVGSAPGKNDFDSMPVVLPDEEVLRPFGEVQAHRAGQITDEEPQARRPYRDLEVVQRPVSGSGGAGLYWLCLLGLSLFVGVFGFPPGQRGPSGGEGIWILIMAMPAVQLAATVFSLLGVLLLRPENQAAAARKIGKITLGMVLGTLIGTGAMVLCCGLSPLGLFR